MKKADRIEAEREREVARLVAFNAILAENRIFGFNQTRDERYPEYREPNGPQRALLEAWRDPRYKVFTFSGGNRLGKTFIGGLIAVCALYLSRFGKEIESLRIKREWLSHDTIELPDYMNLFK